MDEAAIKYYEELTLKKTVGYDTLIRALNIVQRYVFKHKLIIIGGQSIDYAIKSKHALGIYEDRSLPDIDIVTNMHYQHAYEIAVILAKQGFKGISVINAMHPATMKIRINFQELCDLTYIPTNILDSIPTLWYKGYHIIHPHFQFIDQHRSLSYPYENPPFETILNRPKKDMSRYDMLYSYFPLRILNVKTTHIRLMQKSIDITLLQNQCINGFFALNYWIQEAKKMGFQSTVNIGDIYDITSDIIKYQIPEETTFVIYSDNIKELYTNIKKAHDVKYERFHTRFLDKLPRKVILDDYEIYDNNQKISAHKVSFGKETNVYMANIQHIMLYFLINYVILARVNNKCRNYAYYVGYLECRNIIVWASNLYKGDESKNDKKFELFFPTSEIYGERNISESYIVALDNFNKKSKHITNPNFKYTQPKHIYDRDLLYKKIPKKYLEYDISTSEIFNIDGKVIPNFLCSAS